MEKKFSMGSGQADLYQPDPKSVGNCFPLIVNLQEGSKLQQIALVGADKIQCRRKISGKYHVSVYKFPVYGLCYTDIVGEEAFPCVTFLIIPTFIK